MRIILVSLLAALLLAACSASRPLTLTMARGFCNTDQRGDGDDNGKACKDQLEICSQFFDPLAEGVEDQAACLAHCKAVYDGMFHLYAVDPCRDSATVARDYCDQYCLGKYR